MASCPSKPKHSLRRSPRIPGVSLLAEDGELIYVGKARNLKNRVRVISGKPQSAKTMAMVQQIATLKSPLPLPIPSVLLEYNLIKKHRPRYNVTLPRRKSFPYIYINTQDTFQQIRFYRARVSCRDAFLARIPAPLRPRYVAVAAKAVSPTRATIVTLQIARGLVCSIKSAMFPHVWDW